ncbi:hypothetical protein P7C73_g3241, partial [Tremellales sp. Uapishka_1]
MDYLSILATRSLMLFPSASKSSFTSPPSSPATPTLRLSRPAPISMSIQAVISNDANCAYFLLLHILSSSVISLGGVDKARMSEAEVMVWGEIGKAKSFARDLGEWFARLGSIEEAALRAMAEKWGLGIKEEGKEELYGDGEKLL